MNETRRARLKTALAGCGRIGERHARILASSPESELVAHLDPEISRAEAFARRYGGRPYSSVSEMVAVESPGLVAICTPSGLHATGAIELCRLQVPNIVVEKPMALTLSDADAMIEAAASSGARLFVVKQNRYNLAIVKLQEALDRGRFGRLVLGAVRVRWCRRQDYYDQASWRGTLAMDGGVFANQASHHVDMLVHMLGEVSSVVAMAATRLVSIEAEDTGAALLRFKNGALGVIEATTAARPIDLEGSISILGERGTVEVGGFAMNEMTVWRFIDSGPEDADVLDRFRTNPPDVYGFGHTEFYRQVFETIAKEKEPSLDGAEGRKSLEVITAIYESIASGREVSLPFKPTFSRLGRSMPEPGTRNSELEDKP